MSDRRVALSAWLHRLAKYNLATILMKFQNSGIAELHGNFTFVMLGTTSLSAYFESKSVTDVPLQSPGEFIRDLLVERGWTQRDLAVVLGVVPSRVTELIQGRKVIDAELAIGLSEAFIGTDPKHWLSMDAEYRLSKITQTDESIRKRARLLEIVPLKDMERRGWIPTAVSPEEIENQLCRFFGTTSLDDIPDLDVSTRKSTIGDKLTPPQRAWCFYVRSQASNLVVSSFDSSKLDLCVERLRRLTNYAPEARKVQQTLSEFGIRFLIVEPLPGAKIDGAALWLNDGPIIALSLRHDRIDYFWFTLFHELAHIINGDGLSVDSDLVGKEAVISATKSDIERRADNDAAAMLIPSEKLESFIMRVAPMYSKERIIQFAHRNKVHPGIVVGQLQHRGQIGFNANREMLVPIRDIAIATSVVDGWGRTIS